MSLHDLCDVLLLLPLDIVTDNVWNVLTDRNKERKSICLRRFDGGRGHLALRQTSKPVLQLCNLLVTSLNLKDSSSAPGSSQIPDAEKQEAWDLEAARRAAFLARLPRLSSLQLSKWPCETALTTLLTLYGGATQNRVTHLTLDGDLMSPGTMRAVRLACPNLHWLHLTCNRIQVLKASAAVSGNLLKPLVNLPLTHVSSKLALYAHICAMLHCNSCTLWAVLRMRNGVVSNEAESLASILCNACQNTVLLDGCCTAMHKRR